MSIIWWRRYLSRRFSDVQIKPDSWKHEVLWAECKTSAVKLRWTTELPRNVKCRTRSFLKADPSTGGWITRPESKFEQLLLLARRLSIRRTSERGFLSNAIERPFCERSTGKASGNEHQFTAVRKKRAGIHERSLTHRCEASFKNRKLFFENQPSSLFSPVCSRLRLNFDARGVNFP